MAERYYDIGTAGFENIKETTEAELLVPFVDLVNKYFDNIDHSSHFDDILSRKVALVWGTEVLQGKGENPVQAAGEAVLEEFPYLRIKGGALKTEYRRGVDGARNALSKFDIRPYASSRR